jgi:hypothetical protein
MATHLCLTRDPVFARREVLSGSGEAGDPDLIAHVVSTNWGRVINRDSTRRGPVIKR